MVRSPTRIRPILDLLEEIWNENSDMRLGQLMENMNYSWHTEDLNEGIMRMCEFGNKDPKDYILWGTRGIDGRSQLEYKKLSSLETSHLESIIIDFDKGRYDVSSYILDNINSILNERRDGA